MESYTVRVDEDSVIVEIRAGAVDDPSPPVYNVSTPYPLNFSSMFSQDERIVPLTKLVAGAITLRPAQELTADPRTTSNSLIQKVRAMDYEEIVLRLARAIRDLGDELEASGANLGDRPAYLQLKNFLDTLES